MTWTKRPDIPGIYWGRMHDRCGSCWRYDLVRVRTSWIGFSTVLPMFCEGFDPEEFWHEPVHCPQERP